MQGFVSRTVDMKVSLVATDDHRNYVSFKTLGYKHKSVNHSLGEYVRGMVHTANLDSFRSLLKRGIVGTFHNVSKDYFRSTSTSSRFATTPVSTLTSSAQSSEDAENAPMAKKKPRGSDLARAADVR